MIVTRKGTIKDEAKVTSLGKQKTDGAINQNSKLNGGTVWGRWRIKIEGLDRDVGTRKLEDRKLRQNIS